LQAVLNPTLAQQANATAGHDANPATGAAARSAGPGTVSSPDATPRNSAAPGSNVDSLSAQAALSLTAAATTGSPATAGAVLTSSQQPVAAQPTPIPQAAPAQTVSGQLIDIAAQPAQLTSQLAGPLLSLRAGGDGVRQLSIALHPAELGALSVQVRLHDGSMSIQLAGSSAATDALRAALPQLHHELQAAGLNGADVTFAQTASDGSSGQAGGSGLANQGGGWAGGGSAPSSAPVMSTVAVATHLRPTGRASTTELDRWL